MLRAVAILVLCMVQMPSASPQPSAQAEADTEAFSRWIVERGIEGSSLQVVADAGGGMGRGVVARSDLREGDMLLRVPLRWVLHSAAARLLPGLGDALQKAKGMIPAGMRGEKLVVSLMLMFEDCKKGLTSAECALSREQSHWRPYIEVLPKIFTAPVFWSQKELAELSGSQILDMHAVSLD